MGLKRIKTILRTAFLFLLVLIASCEEQGIIVNCQECVLDEPEYVDVEIKTDIRFPASTTINIYEGSLEDGILLRAIQASGTISKTTLRLNKKYTFTAIYFFSNSYYTAVDSATPRVTYNKDQCDDPCYYIYDKTVNLRIKYSK